MKTIGFRNRMLIVSLAALLGLALVAIARFGPPIVAGQMPSPAVYRSPADQATPVQGSLNVSVDSDWPKSPEANAKWAETIVLGTVRQVGRAGWNTADGSRAADVSPRAMERDKSQIYRTVVIDVERYLKNPQPANEVAIMALGGTVGTDSIVWRSNIQDYEPGERVLVFLYKRPSEAQDPAPVWSINEKYTVAKDGTASTEFASMPLAELIGRIEAQMAKQYP